MLKDIIKGIGHKPIDYEKAKELARHADPDVRRELAAREDLKPELLYFLAEDTHPAVRLQIAHNAAAPRQADMLLARDVDDDVRIHLAQKIAKLAPGLTADEQDKVRRMTYDALVILTRDQVTRVRQVISDALKDVANAPPEVINRLARDAELVVAAPVLEFSPVLTDDDLLEIIASDPVHGALSCISRRPKVIASVADAIVAADDSEAVTHLLANPSAQIREETLDLIIERAPDRVPWHAPLVRRPKLPAGAAFRLARFVAANLLEILTHREDLDPEIVAAVKVEVRRRLDEEDGEVSDQAEAETEETTFEMATRLQEAGELTDDAVDTALAAGRREFVMAALAVRAGLPMGAVMKAMNNRSAKGVVAVAWKAGLPMATALEVQKRIAAIPLTFLVKAGPEGEYPLSEDEMEWQLEFIADGT